MIQVFLQRSSVCVLFSRGYKVPKNIKHLIDFSKVPAKIDFDKEVKEILARGLWL